MVNEHVNLGAKAFGVTPDARFLYLSRTHREAMASLVYGIQSERGFTALIAAPGMGKTTLLFHLLNHLKGIAKTAFLFQTLCGPEDLLRALLADLGIKDDSGDMASLHANLNAYLLEESKYGRQVIVIIDEAQNLDNRVLELVRMLSNFEAPGKKLMQIVLSGQPQLATRLASDNFVQLRQRISIVARLAPLNSEETREYIEHRLRVACVNSDRPLFSDQAYAMIAKQSAGIPRNINNLCFNSMSLACALKQSRVDGSMIEETVNDLDLTAIRAPQRSESGLWSSVFEKLGAVFASRRYRASLATAFLMNFALMACLWATSKYRTMPENATKSSQQKSNDASDLTPVAQDLPQQEVDKHLPQSTRNELNGSGKLVPLWHTEANHSISSHPANVRRPNPHRPRAGKAPLEKRQDRSLTAKSTPDLSPLPLDLRNFQLFRIADLSDNQQTLKDTLNSPNQNSAPSDFVPQREKP